MPVKTKPHTLNELFVEELKDMYDGEKQLVRALPKLAKTATNSDLKKGINDHLTQTEEHVARIERIFGMLDLKAQGKKCEGIQGILSEGKVSLEDCDDDNVRDASLIASAQKVEHYEIASYGTLHAWANQLGMDEAGALLQKTLDEEKRADAKLSEVAEQMVNVAAL